MKIHNYKTRNMFCGTCRCLISCDLQLRLFYIKTSRLVKLTWAERCAHNELLFGYRWLHMFWPFKVVQGHQLLHKLKPHMISCDHKIWRRERSWQVAQLWQRDRTTLTSFLINVQLYWQNHIIAVSSNPAVWEHQWQYKRFIWNF